jgi:hypothetical protein
MEKKTTKIVELVIDENHEEITIDAISLVTEPAIAENFVYFNKEKHNLTLAKVDEEQKLLVSPALIPNKNIYRFDAENNQEYYVFFTESTVKKASEMYLKYNNNNNATVQHENKITGVHTVESWIVQDPKMDKSRLYGYDVPKGTWFVSMKIENEEIIKRIKDGELRGLSIEGYFTDKMAKMSKFARVGSMVTDGKDGKIDLPLYDNEDDALAKAKELGCSGVHSHSLDGKEVFMPCSDHDIISNLSEILKEDCECMDTELISPNPCTSGYVPYGHKIKDGKKVPNCVPVNAKKTKKKKEKKTILESYNDYPQSASNNACKVLRWIDEHGRDEVKGMTRVGLARANQLCNKENITRETISRMASFKRHEKNAEIDPKYKSTPWKDKGYVAWLGWGGTSGVNWAIKKLKQIDSKK